MNFSQLTGNEGLFCDGDWIEKKIKMLMEMYG